MSDIQLVVVNARAGSEAIESIFIQPIGSVLNVYTIINADDDDVRDAIYEREAELLRRFEDYHFDFNVIARRGRPVEQLLGAAAPLWQRVNWPCPSLTNM